jgi:hypothetical protein
MGIAFFFCVVFIVCNVSSIVCVALCAVFCLGVVCYFVWYVNFCVLCHVVMRLTPSKNLLPVQLNNNNKHRLCGQVIRVPGYRSKGPGLDSRYYIFWEVVGLERGPLSLVSTTEELLGGKSRGSGLENREYNSTDTLWWTRNNPLSAKLGSNFAKIRRSLGRNN